MNTKMNTTMNTTMRTTMSTVHDEIVERPGERGVALIGTLLLLMMVSALAAALGVNGQTETLISRNQRSATQAAVAAEAGLNHAIALVSTFISESGANGFADDNQARDSLLLGPDSASGTVATDADNGSLGTRTGIDAAEAIPIGAQLNIAAGVDATYEAIIMDDDATAPDEPGGDLYDDENEILIVRATGYGPDDTKVVLEAMVGPVTIPGLFINGDLSISGNPSIEGTDGSLHTNGDLDISGSPSVSGTVTATGSYSGSHPGSGGATTVDVMVVRASDYLADADYILTSNGRVTQPNGTVVCDASSDTGACKDSWGWDYKGLVGLETYEDGADGNTFYVEADVSLGSNSGSSSDPMQLTIIAEGSIKVGANPHLIPNTPQLMFVTDGDLEISGNPEMHAPGQILVHEQIKLNGNAVLIGPVAAEDAANVHDLVIVNEISGDPTLTYNGGMSGGVRLIGWWDVRDAD